MTSDLHPEPGAAIPARARLVDVAERAGVTKAVVSRLMNDDPSLRIRPETRERVLAVASELDYRPNATARALSVARTSALAILVPDLSNSAYAAITRGAFRRAQARGYVLLIAEDSTDDTQDADYAELVTTGRVDGLLVASARPRHPLVERLLAAPAEIAHVFLNREVGGSENNVRMDMRQAGAVVVDHLMALGHEHIGMVTGPSDQASAQSRLEGFRSAMRGRGLDGSAFEAAAFSELGGLEGAQALLSARPELTAVCASTFTQAAGVMKGVRRLGLAIPREISIVGYDDVPLADYLEPGLTTLVMPLAELGAVAVDALIDQIEGRGVVVHDVPGGFRIVERESVARARM